MDESDKEIWKDREYYWIEKLNARDLSVGYNLAYGGGGLSEVTDEKREILRQKNLGKKLSEETKNKISEGNKGKVLTEETKNKISESHKGKKMSEEAKQNISKAMTGKTREFTEEHKQNISKGLTGLSHPWQDKINKNPEKIKKMAEKHTGMKRSDEAKENMRIAAKKRFENGGEANNKGKKWIHNPITLEKRYINQDEILPEGFVYGMGKHRTK